MTTAGAAILLFVVSPFVAWIFGALLGFVIARYVK